VATPTKLMTYMGNGVIPIVSDCLDGLLENVGKSKFVVKISDSQDERPILEFINQTINADEIENDYEKIYREHYDAEIHIKNMINVLPS
jgi:hypothetical protein